VVQSALAVHQESGPGLLESIYEVCLCHKLRKRGFHVERQVVVPIRYDNIVFDEGLRLDVLVEQRVICEIKAVVEIHPVFQAQLLTCLKLTGNRLGSLINFNVPLIKDGIKRMVR
jgi:GxxExxY protein